MHRQNKPATLRDALQITLELESYQLASRQTSCCVREAQLEDDHPVQWQSFMPASVEDVLQQLAEAIQGIVRPCADRAGVAPASI